jgi:putative FmdB family regulatory protein
MPIFEYACEKCETRFEVLVLNKKTSISCPKCASAKASLLPSVFAGRRGSLKRLNAPDHDPRADFRAKHFEGWMKEQKKKKAATPKSGPRRTGRPPEKTPRIV